MTELPQHRRFYFADDDTRSVRKPLPLYTVEQMRAFWEAGRRVGLEQAASEAEHWQKIGQNPEHKCGEYIAGAIRGL